MFWKAIGVSVVVGLFVIGYGLYPRGDELSPSLASFAYAADAGPTTIEKKLVFQSLTTQMGAVKRAKVPGGWLVIFDVNGDSNSYTRGAGITFFPDPSHQWDGSSLK